MQYVNRSQRNKANETVTFVTTEGKTADLLWKALIHRNVNHCCLVCVCARTFLLTGQSSQKRYYSFYFRTQNTIMALMCQKQNRTKMLPKLHLMHSYIFCFFFYLTAILFFSEVCRFLRTTVVQKSKSYNTHWQVTIWCRSHNTNTRKKIFQQPSIHRCRKYSHWPSTAASPALKLLNKSKCV